LNSTENNQEHSQSRYEERLEIALRVAGIGVFDWVIGEDSLVWSQKQCELFFKDPSDFNGKIQDWIDCIAPEDRILASARFFECVQRSDFYTGEFRIGHPSTGEIRIIQSHAQIFRESNGCAYRVVGINRDVTQDRQLERALAESQKKSDEAARIKSNFLANMSHEIRTPMNAIIGMAELALESEMSDEARENITTVVDSADYLLDLLNEVLDFSKIEAKKLEIAWEAVDIHSLLQSAIEMYKNRLSSKNIVLKTKFSSQIPAQVKSDPLRVKQVVTNLLSNAIKFTPVGGEVIVETMLESEGNDLRIIVNDNGIGVPVDRRDAIFEPFRQADSSTTRNYGGTGLGLSISRRIAELLNGKLYLQNSDSLGSTFIFEFPCIPIEQRMGELEVNTAASAPEKRIDLSWLKVLVAEDNLVNQKVIIKMLKSYNIVPFVVDNGEKVIEHLAEGSPVDLIFMDCQMPVMSGYESTREIRIRESAGNQRVIILAMTANALEGDRELCIECGMDDYLSKPLRSGALDELLCSWADKIKRRE
jgi:two-component system sensor histidine kinase/response regulator